MRAVSKKRAHLNRQRAKVLKQLRAEQNWCSLCGEFPDVLDGHELLSRARGGSIVDVDNIVLLCRTCHDFITTNPAWAEANGWALSQYVPRPPIGPSYRAGSAGVRRVSRPAAGADMTGALTVRPRGKAAGDVAHTSACGTSEGAA